MAVLARPSDASSAGGAHGAPWGRALSYWLLSYRRTWRGTVFSGFLSPLLFLAAMGFGLGALIDEGGQSALGVPYLAFIAPGVLAAQAMQTAVGESTFPVMGAMKWQRQYHAMLAASLRVGDIVAGHLVFVALRVAIASAVFLAVAALLGALQSWWVLLALPVTVLCGMAFAAPTFAVAVRAESDMAFNVLFRFVVMPLFLFSGTFFPVSQLPGVLQPVAWVTPLWHAVEVCRSLSLGNASVLGVLAHSAYLLLWVAAGVVLAHRSFRSRLVV